LLHDDVLDEANLRRGRASINRRWGTRHAVLLGDFLLSRSFRLLQHVGSMRVMGAFVEAALDLGEGALTEQIHRDNLNLSENLYFYIITRKTASFFRACAQAGAILANASEQHLNLLHDFGLNYGIAFQITDDLMDVISDESTMGKPRGKDILEGHLTLPLIKYFEKDRNNIPDTKLSDLKPTDDEFTKLMDGLSRDGSISYSYAKAETYQKKALDSLDKLPSNDATDYLRTLTIELLRRKS
jgi:octaprenyl-diphosphate synthase